MISIDKGERGKVIPTLANGLNIFKYNSETFTNTNEIWFYTQSGQTLSGTEDVFVSDVMLFEGDLTQTPELIPTEYVEGLKSSFEDGYIPENVVTKLGIIPDISQGNGITISGDNYTFPSNNLAVMFHHSNFNKPHTFVVIPSNDSKTQQYTVHSMTNSINVQVYQYALGFHTFLFNQPANMYRMYTENPVNSTFRILILEGDWTHLTEEDCNNLGKYKVEYKVTGKNKFDKDDIRYVGQIYSDAGLLYNNENYNVGGYIECNKKQYILSGDTNDGSNYNGDYIIEFNEKKEFIKRTYMTKGLINLDDTTKYISVCPYITSKNIQIEEGTVAQNTNHINPILKHST